MSQQLPMVEDAVLPAYPRRRSLKHYHISSCKCVQLQHM